MNYLISILITAVCFLVFWNTYWIWAVNQARREGKLPGHKPTMFDVQRLLKEGEKEAAIRLYIQIFKVSLKQARKDVEELERSLNV